MSESADILVIGGGISGVSLAARLSSSARVIMAEAEAHLGTHATGRSAALLVEAYGPPEIRRLTTLSRSFFEAPPEGFAEAPLSRRRGALVYAIEAHLPRLESEFEKAAAVTKVERLSAEGVVETCPLMRPGIAAGGFLEPGVLDLDTNALVQGFARMVRQSGGTILLDARGERINRRPGGWAVRAGGHEISCGVIVDAAGAWAERIAALAGASPLGLTPMRRTAATIVAPPEFAGRLPTHPAAIPVDESFYFKPDSQAIMVSLSEETPSEPCDAYPEDLDVALALERFHEATIVPRARPTATWAGLRTFAPDRLPVVGYDPDVEGFFWYAGQGGYGIQTSPALSALGAKLVLGAMPDVPDLAEALSPRRTALR
ncbi:MAG: NAD(P)/FAD-dependent oxidoreductase [Propylenella sp.]